MKKGGGEERVRLEGREREACRFFTAGFEDRGKVHKPRNSGDLKEEKKQRNRFFPRTPMRNADMLTI